MTLKNVKSFIARLGQDETLQNHIGPDASAEDIVAVAHNAGFDFSVDDLAAAQAAKGGPMELSDSDLESVAGAGQLLWSLFRCKDTGGSMPKPGDPKEPQDPKDPLDPFSPSGPTYTKPVSCPDPDDMGPLKKK